MALATMQKANLDEIEPDVHGRIAKASAQLEGVTVTRVTFRPGARWSKDLKTTRAPRPASSRTSRSSCAVGCTCVWTTAVRRSSTPGDVMMLPPGHDAWSVGNEACVFVEFSRGNDYYD